MTGDHSTDSEIADLEARRAVEIANGHIAEAEDILWTVANSVESDEYADELEDVTRAIWDIQHQLMDLQRALDS